MVYVDNVRSAMGQVENVRNIAVIAHVDHGKTTLTDALLARAGVISLEQAGEKRATDTRKDEQQKGITIKSTAVSLYFELAPNCSSTQGEAMPQGRSVVVNLIDSPGHIDFSSEVTAALRVADGALVVVDCIEGVCVQTETVLRQALMERIRPVLMINKLDRAIFEVQLSPEAIYNYLQRIVQSVNVVVSLYGGDSGPMGDISLDPAKGNVAFGSGLHGWGFNLSQFASMYAEKFKLKKEKIMKRLWGDNFYNPTSGTWSKQKEEGSRRGFNMFVIEPLMKMLKAAKENDKDAVFNLSKRININLDGKEKQAEGKQLMKIVMKKWLPAAEGMLGIIVDHLPSPKVAQQYRTEILYEGPLDDPVATAMKKCDPEGPLMMFVSKMVPSPDVKNRFYAIGRVFSGRVTSGMKVRIMGPDYQPGNDKDTNLFIKSIQRTKICMGGSFLSVNDVPCGNIIALAGVDNFLQKTGTITTYEQAHNLKVLKFSVSPVVRVAVDVKNPADLQKLVEGLKKLSKSDNMVQCTMDSGQHIVAGAGELQLEIVLKDLEDVFAGVPIMVSDPVVSYQETVNATSDRVCLAKSRNKHNRLFMTAEPLPDGLPEDIEQGNIKITQDVKDRSEILVGKYDFDSTDAKKIWCFGPEGSGPNLLVDTSRGVQYLQDIKDSVVAGFQWATQEGPLCESNVRGVRFNLTDARVHQENVIRNGAQIIPATRRVLLASMLTAKPSILEPIYLVEVMCPKQHMGTVYNIVSMRRGKIFEEVNVENTPMCTLKGYLPVSESFGFNAALRMGTGGQAFPQCFFDHWQLLPGDPLDQTSKAGRVVVDIRKRKGLSEDVPTLDNYLDKL